MTSDNLDVLFLRLEAPLQSWGFESRFRTRDTALEPTKSGVIGLIACCLALRRGADLCRFHSLKMGVRVDRPGFPWRDYHTVGAGTQRGCMSADGRIKHTASTGEPEALTTDRYYLCDASFLVALSGPALLLDEVEEGVQNPLWPPYLGRKCCPPAVPILPPVSAPRRGTYLSLADALSSYPWRPRIEEVDKAPCSLRSVVECGSSDEGAVLRLDVPVSFAEPRPMQPRYVCDIPLNGFPVGAPSQNGYRSPQRPRMKYDGPGSPWDLRRRQRACVDGFRCVFCGLPSYVTHHVTYERVNREDVERDLRSMCNRCHDALSMIEAERGMGRDRMDPLHLSPADRSAVLQKRMQIEKERKVRYERGRR